LGTNSDFSAYMAARWSRLVRAAILLGCSNAEAEDVAQTALTRCLRHWRRIEQAQDRDAYVHKILLNTFLASRGRKWATEITVAEVPDQSRPDVTTEIDQLDALERGLSRLPHDQRVAVVLRYYSHLTEQQMAEVLGVPAGTVKSRLSRALKTLAADPSLEELRDVR